MMASGMPASQNWRTSFSLALRASTPMALRDVVETLLPTFSGMLLGEKALM